MERSFILTTIRGVVILYLDPGSGSLFIQLIIGAILGLGVLIRVFWKNIKNFFTKGNSSPVEVSDPTTIVDDPSESASVMQPKKPTDKTI